VPSELPAASVDDLGLFEQPPFASPKIAAETKIAFIHFIAKRASVEVPPPYKKEERRPTAPALFSVRIEALDQAPITGSTATSS
jgi:hypothetical protein